MASRAIAKAPLPVEVVASDRNRLDQLVHELSSLADAASTPESALEPDSVLLDIEVNGVRCVLMRKPSQRAHTLLSPREVEIARLVAKGYPNKVIASVLDISCWTVSTHLRRVFVKLGTTSRAAMVAKLRVENLLG